MRLQVVAGALALAGPAIAFSDSSPWVLASTSPLSNALNDASIQTSSQVLGLTRDFLAGCPTERYLVVDQPGVNAADLFRPNNEGCSMAHLCETLEHTDIRGKYTVSEVVGDLSNAGLSSYIKHACAKKGQEVRVDELDLASPSSEDRLGALMENDITFAQRLGGTTEGGSYTIIFLSTPGEPAYETEFDEPVRMDLKRHTQGSPVRRRANETERDTRPLFEKYQFFTPGIFMGLITAIVLFSILGVGVRALASLEVSYGAFEKDMGPAAQKKQ